jgi:Subunit ChlI of Mg-chelatase
MVQRVATVAFEGIEARAVDVQVQVAPGLPAFNIVGLPDKAVSEAKERVRAALIASDLALPARRITVNLAPADLPKEGSHYDLPIALGLMAAIGAIPQAAISGFTVLGELGLDGSIAAVAGVLPAAIGANARAGADLPERLRAGSGLGIARDRDRRRAFVDPARQSFQRQSGAVAPATQDSRDRRRRARPCRHQGPGKRQARTRSRRRRRP